MLTLAIPVYNMEQYLPRCMETMLAQTCQDFEILLVDDGSTDNSGQMCDDYAAKHSDFIRVVHKENGGLSSARNAGIDAAKGKYPIFLKEALRLSHSGSIILADNILYKGYVMSDYNKHKQRTAVTHLREYIKETMENPNLKTDILEIGDGLAVSKVR